MACLGPSTKLNLSKTPSKECQRRAILAADLVDSAILGLFIGPPAEKFCSVAETPASEMIELHLSHQPGIERLPFCRALRAPAARASRRAAGETRRLDHPFQF